MSFLAGILPRARRRSATAALLLAALAAGGVDGAAAIDGTPPYPPSTYLTGIELDWSSFSRQAEESDNWPTTRAADGTVYTSFADGGGFGPNAAERAYVSLGVARLEGNSARTLTGRNLIGGLDPEIGRCFPRLGGLSDPRDFGSFREICDDQGMHGKSRSILALDGNLYMFITPGSLARGYDEARLFKAPLGTNDWTRADWAFTRQDSPRLLSPELVQAGRNNSDSSFVYAYASRYAPADHFGLHDGPNGGEIHLLRADKGANLMQRDSWEFFAGSANAPAWSPQQAASEPVFVDRRGVGWQVSGIFAAPLGRWLMITEHDRSHDGNLGIFEAPDPWGPWRTVYYDKLTNAAQGVPATTFYANFLADSLDGDGSFTLLFTGTGANDALNAVDGRFEISANGRR